jgi:hypothetical protein
MLTIPRPVRTRAPRPRLRFARYRGSSGRIAFSSRGPAAGDEQATSHQVLAHVAAVAAAETAVEVVLSSGDSAVGRLGFPLPGSRLLPFWTLDGARLPPLGDGRACLRYAFGRGCFEVYTRVRERWSGLVWQLQLPRGSLSGGGRLAHRHPLADWRFVASAIGPAEICDLSTSGVSLTVADAIARPVGDALIGLVEGPGEAPIPARLTVRRVEASSTGRTRMGCSFDGLGFDNLLRIAHVVQALHRAPGGLRSTP